jgi:hypothetical protein
MSSSIFKDLHEQKSDRYWELRYNEAILRDKERAELKELSAWHDEWMRATDQKWEARFYRKEANKSLGIIGRNGPEWFESRDQALEYLRSQELTPREQLERSIESLDEVLFLHAAERRAELRNDSTIDQERIDDIVAIEINQLLREREQLCDRLRDLNAELGFQQEMGMER